MKIAGWKVPWWAVGVAMAAIAAAVFVGIGANDDRGGRADSASTSQTPSGSAGTDGSQEPSASAGTATNPKTVASGTVDPSSGGGGSGSASSEDGSDDPASPAVGQVVVKFWDDTQSDEPSGLVVKAGKASWAAKPGSDSDAGKLSITLGKTVTLEVYPDGTSGKKITVPVVVTSAMSGKEPDAIHVEVRDGEVRVLGNPVVGFEVTSARG